MLKVLEFKFDKSSKNWVEGNPAYNLCLLITTQAYFNQLLKTRGRVSLDHILNHLDIPVPAGLGFYGWDREVNGDQEIKFNFDDQVKDVSDGKQDFVYLRFNINTEKEVTT